VIKIFVLYIFLLLCRRYSKLLLFFFYSVCTNSLTSYTFICVSYDPHTICLFHTCLFYSILLLCFSHIPFLFHPKYLFLLCLFFMCLSPFLCLFNIGYSVSFSFAYTTFWVFQYYLLMFILVLSLIYYLFISNLSLFIMFSFIVLITLFV